MQELLLTELAIAQKNSIACGKDENDVSVLLLSILKLINSGAIEGEVKFRINQHTITKIKMDNLKVSLNNLEEIISIAKS